LPLAEASAPTPLPDVPTPPPTPRDLPANYAWRMLLTDGWAIAAFVFFLLGGIFSVLGFILTIAVVTAFVGIPFLGIGVPFLAAGLLIVNWRRNQAQQMLTVLRTGEAALGQVVDVSENLHVRINGRYPWTITYHFRVEGNEYTGQATTLRTPDRRQQPGQSLYVLYLPDDPAQNTIYPPVM
jgi:hypothetical protein